MSITNGENYKREITPGFLDDNSETKAASTPLSTPYPPTLAAAASGSANAAIVTVKTNYKTSQRRPTPVAPRKKLHRR